MNQLDGADLVVGGTVAEVCRPCLVAVGCDPGLALALAVAIGVALQVSRLVLPVAWQRMMRRREPENTDEPQAD